MGIWGTFSDLPVVFVQFFGFDEVIFDLERLGLFDFILPFLLLFAVVYGVLMQTRMFGENKGVQVLIALVIGLLGIRFPIYTDFLAVISPKLGIGLMVLLVLVLLIGLFVPEGSQAILGWIMIGVGVVIGLVILVQTYSFFEGYGYSGFFSSNVIAWVVLVALLIGIIVAVVASNSNKEPPSRRIGKFFGDAVKEATK